MQDNIIIRQAGMNEIEKVMLFLREHWGKDHIMANSKELMCYEHAWNGEFTFMIAEDSITQKIYGVYGYIPYSKEVPRDMGGGIWKVIQNPCFLLGVELFKYVQDPSRCRMFADCGANPKTIGHRKLIGHVNQNLEQYYRLNSTISTFAIAVIKDRKISRKRNGTAYPFLDLKTMDLFRRYFDVT